VLQASRLTVPKEIKGKTAIMGLLHEFTAELVGTFTMIVFGCGVVASQHMQQGSQLQESKVSLDDAFGSDLYVNTGWGLAVAFGVMISFETSGAHLNPAVTLPQMIFFDMSVARGLVYMAAQFLGAILGALIVTVNYVVFKGADALTNFYCTAPFQGVSNPNAFFQEVLATMLLLASISAITTGKPPPNKFLVAGFVGLLVFAIGNCQGSQTGFAMNPARDFGPRLVWALFFGLYGKPDLYETVFHGTYWLVPMFAPMVGGPLGTLFHRLAHRPARRSALTPAISCEAADASLIVV